MPNHRTTQDKTQSDRAGSRIAKLDAMRAAASALTSDLDLNAVLQKVVDLSRELVNARYAALGVLNAEGTEIEQFITAGISSKQRARIGPFPRGRGLLGAIIKEGRPIRVDDIAADPRATGDPGHHPHMHTFLGVPIVSKGRVFGNLYLTDKQVEEKLTTEARRRHEGDGEKAATEDAKIAYPPFTLEDEETLELFAMQAAIAIENALLHRQSEALIIAEERGRIAMDLHDGIIQSIYAVGMTLDDGRFYLDKDPKRTRERIDRAIDDLNGVIGDLRNYILDLEPERFRERDLATGLEDLARELRAGSFLQVDTQISDQAAERLSHEQTKALLHIAKEALANARKHARATRIDITFRPENGKVHLVIEDDGVGMDVTAEQAQGPGNGLANMAHRAEQLGGTLEVESEIGHGTRIIVVSSIQSES
jgi:signal transduction histidine kinase